MELLRLVVVVLISDNSHTYVVFSDKNHGELSAYYFENYE